MDKCSKNADLLVGERDAGAVLHVVDSGYDRSAAGGGCGHRLIGSGYGHRAAIGAYSQQIGQ